MEMFAKLCNLFDSISPTLIRSSPLNILLKSKALRVIRRHMAEETVQPYMTIYIREEPV